MSHEIAGWFDGWQTRDISVRITSPCRLFTIQTLTLTAARHQEQSPLTVCLVEIKSVAPSFIRRRLCGNGCFGQVVRINLDHVIGHGIGAAVAPAV